MRALGAGAIAWLWGENNTAEYNRITPFARAIQFQSSQTHGVLVSRNTVNRAGTGALPHTRPLEPCR